ncbi:MAG: universal stress protein [Kofleriaceae bacterium]
MIATDLSPAADEAIKQGHARALAARASIAICHVLPDAFRGHPMFPHLGVQSALSVPQMRDRVTAMIADRTCELTGRTPEEFEVLLDDGVPHAVILQQAERWRADLVIVGSQGSTGLARILLGSVAERVVRHAQTPVLVARPSSGSGQILVGTDFSDPTLPAVAAAAAEAKLGKRNLTILHAIEVPFVASTTFSYLSVPFGGVAYGGLDSASMAAIEKAVDRSIGEVLSQIDAADAQRSVVWGAPGPAIVQAAVRLAAELVVVGTVGRTGLDRVLLGSTAEKVVRAAPCSVLVVRLAG